MSNLKDLSRKEKWEMLIESLEKATEAAKLLAEDDSDYDEDDSDYDEDDSDYDEDDDQDEWSQRKIEELCEKIAEDYNLNSECIKIVHKRGRGAFRSDTHIRTVRREWDIY